MKKILILITILTLGLAPMSVFAGNSSRKPLAYRGFSGGMMLHAGWLWGGKTALQTPQGEPLPALDMAGITTGIGGGLRFHFGNHLRIGAEGYGTYLKYGEHLSKFGIGWGGLCVDYQFLAGKFYPYLGVTVGGGTATNLTFPEYLVNDFITEQHVSYRKYSFAAVTPFIGVEYELNQRMRLIVKADWLMNVSNPQPDFPKGPRIYIGFSFYHLKK